MRAINLVWHRLSAPHNAVSPPHLQRVLQVRPLQLEASSLVEVGAVELDDNSLGFDQHIDGVKSVALEEERWKPLRSVLSFPAATVREVFSD